MNSNKYENMITCCLCGKEVKTKDGYYAYPIRPHIAEDGSKNICCEDCYNGVVHTGRIAVFQKTVADEDALSFLFQMYPYEELKIFFELLNHTINNNI